MKQVLSIAAMVLLAGCQGDKAQQYIQALDVAERGISGITIDTNSFTIVEPNVTAQWAASADLTSGNTLLYSDQVSWSSDSPKVATVSGDGVISTLSAGVANISARYGRFSDVQTLTVSTAVLQSISLTPASISLDECKTLVVTAAGSYDDGTTRELNGILSWSSDNLAVATLEDKGESSITVVSHSAGAGVLTASNEDGITGTASLTILDTLTSIAIDQISLDLNVGGSASLSAQAEYSDASSAEITQSGNWSLNETAQSSFVSLKNNYSNKGELSATAVGVAIVDMECGGINATQSSTVTVSTDAELQSIAISPIENPYQISTDDTDKSLTLFANYADGSTVDVTVDASWEVLSGDIDFIDIDMSDGNEGNILLDATIGDITEDKSISVKGSYGAFDVQTIVTVEAPTLATLESLSFSPANNPYLLSVNDTDKSITLLANYSDGSTAVDVTADAIWNVALGDSDFISIDTSPGNEGNILLDADISDITEDKSISVQVAYGSLNAQIQIIVEAP